MSITKKQLKFNNQKNKIINKILKLNKKFNDKFLFEEMEKELINFCNGQKYIITIKKINENIKKHKIILSLIKNKKKFFKNLFKKLNKKEKIKKSNITKTIKKSNKKIIEKKENKILAIEYNIDEVKKCSEMQHIINNFGIEINDTEEIINEKDNNYINFICCVFNEKIYELHEKFYNRKLKIKKIEIYEVKNYYKKISLLIHPDKKTKFSNLERMKDISDKYEEFLKIIENIEKENKIKELKIKIKKMNNEELTNFKNTEYEKFILMMNNEDFLEFLKFHINEKYKSTKSVRISLGMINYVIKNKLYYSNYFYNIFTDFFIMLFNKNIDHIDNNNIENLNFYFKILKEKKYDFEYFYLKFISDIHNKLKNIYI